MNNSLLNNELVNSDKIISEKNVSEKNINKIKNANCTLDNQNIIYSLGYRQKENSITNNYSNKEYFNKINSLKDSNNIFFKTSKLNEDAKKNKNFYIVEKLNEYKQNFINKLKLLILEEHSKTPQYIIFNSIIFFVNLLNFIFLLTIHHQMETWETNRIVMVNVACSGIFVIEIIFKILVLGKSYFKDLMNVLDFVVIFAGIAEIAVTNYNSDPYGKIYFFNFLFYKKFFFIFSFINFEVILG